MKDFNMKPNFSELERMYGIDRHTIKKYYENGILNIGLIDFLLSGNVL